MKKKMIAAGAASLALAAMPVVGVFALGTVTDYVQLTVNGSCTLTATEISTQANRINLGTVNAGDATSETTGVAGTPMTISCNTDGGINLTAAPTSLTLTGKPSIPFGAFAAGTSVWSAMVGVTGDDASKVTVSNGWDDFATAKTNGTILTLASGEGVHEIVATPRYKASTASNQPAGTYTGEIVYTFVETPGA